MSQIVSGPSSAGWYRRMGYGPDVFQWIWISRYVNYDPCNIFMFKF